MSNECKNCQALLTRAEEAEERAYEHAREAEDIESENAKLKEQLGEAEAGLEDIASVDLAFCDSNGGYYGAINAIIGRARGALPRPDCPVDKEIKFDGVDGPLSQEAVDKLNSDIAKSEEQLRIERRNLPVEPGERE